MNTVYSVIFLTLAAAGNPDIASEQLLSAEKTELIQDLVSSSGLGDRIMGLPPLISRMMVQGIVAAGDPNEVSEPLRQIVNSTFRASSIKNRMVRELGKKLSMEDLQSIYAFFDSPLGRQIVNLEREASLGGNYSKMTTMSKRLQEASRKDPSRARLLEKLDASTHGSVIAVNLAESMRMGVGHSLLSASRRFDESSRAGLKERVDAAHFRLRGRITQQIFISHLYLFEKMQEERLVTYLEFAESSPGRKYFLAVKEGINSAVNDAFETTDKLLAETVRTDSSS
jgi:hypothetical protein